MQKTFDWVVAHLRKQRRKSERDGIAMLHEDIDETRANLPGSGRRCPAGYLLQSDGQFRYHWTMERANTIYSADIADRLLGLGHNLELVDALVQLHDKVAVEHWEKGFAAIAERFGLDFVDDAFLAA